MDRPPEQRLEESELASLRDAFHAGAAHTSEALGRWLGVPVTISLDSVEQLPFTSASTIVDGLGDCLCCCTMGISGMLGGQLVFFFDEESGLGLADLALERTPRGDREWGEVETSAALETANIVGCCYLNVLEERLSDGTNDSGLLPSPPEFRRDFAASVVEFALMSQVATSDTVILAGTRFHVDGRDLDWTFLIVPDAASIGELRRRIAVRGIES